METIRITSQNCGTPRICRCEGDEPCGDCSVYDLSEESAEAADLGCRLPQRRFLDADDRLAVEDRLDEIRAEKRVVYE